MNGYGPPDNGIPVIETRGRKRLDTPEKLPLLLKALAAKRAGLNTYLEAVDVIYEEYSRNLPAVSSEQEARRKTDIASKIAELDRLN